MCAERPTQSLADSVWITFQGRFEHARSGVVRALNRHVERVFDPSSNDHH
jgi:hypothetical protein